MPEEQQTVAEIDVTVVNYKNFIQKALNVPNNEDIDLVFKAFPIHSIERVGEFTAEEIDKITAACRAMKASNHTATLLKRFEVCNTTSVVDYV